MRIDRARNGHASAPAGHRMARAIMADRLSDLGTQPVERVTGIEPALSAWEADVLPLNYTRAALGPNRASARPDLVPEPTTANRFSRPRPRPRAGAAWPAARRTPAPALQPGPPVPGSGGSPRA